MSANMGERSVSSPSKLGPLGDTDRTTRVVAYGIEGDAARSGSYVRPHQSHFSSPLWAFVAVSDRSLQNLFSLFRTGRDHRRTCVRGLGTVW